MSDYTMESPASVEARQRRRRALITFGVLALGLFFAFWYGLSYYEADTRERAAATTSPTCTPFDPAVIRPEDVTVDVYNSTTREGLAGRTAKDVQERGFTVGKVANDPSKRKTPAVAEVRFGPDGAAQAKKVLEVMPEGTKEVKDKRKGSGVSIALGTKFTELAPAVAASGLPMCPSPSPS